MSWESLTHALPKFINTHGAHELLAELEAVPEDERTDEQTEQLESLTSLREALSADWDRMTEDGGTLNAESDWRDYCEARAYESGDITEHSNVADFVDWDAYADNVKAFDHQEITVESGEFAGTWLYEEN